MRPRIIIDGDQERGEEYVDFALLELSKLKNLWNGAVKVFPPRVSWKGMDGNMRFKIVVSLPKDVEERGSVLILKKYSEEQDGKSHPTHTSP